LIKLDTPPATTKRIDEKIIPMINIIFLLLMFFLIAGNISELVREDVVPPRSSSTVVAISAHTDWILARDGTIILYEQEMNLRQVAAWLAAED
jgi:biopolymer transport protein ExbD